MIVNSKRFKKYVGFGVVAILALSFAGCSAADKLNGNIKNTVEENIGGDIFEASPEKIPNIEGWKVSVENIKTSSGNRVGNIIVQDKKGSNDICTVTGKGSEDVNVDINQEEKEIILTSDKKYLDSNSDLEINISVPITFLQIVGGGYDLDITMKDSKSFYSKFKCAVQGNLNIKNAEKVDLDFAGAGDLDLEGNAKEINIDCKGAGNIEAENFETKNATVTLKGAGNCSVNAKESFDGKIQGVGSISYKGNPKDVKKDVQGLGEISKI